MRKLGYDDETQESTTLHGGDEEKMWWKKMNHTADLSLRPSLGGSYSSSESADGRLCRKRKKHRGSSCGEQPAANDIDSRTAGIELQPKDPLPPDWEQCLDLQSGRMFYVNKRTLRRCWERPRGTAPDIDLELNISAPSGCDERSTGCWEEEQGNPIGNMVAVPCLRCHLLVMLCTSSPSCPNCKYVHSLQSAHQTPPPPSSDLPHSGDAPSLKPLETLSLLN